MLMLLLPGHPRMPYETHPWNQLYFYNPPRVAFWWFSSFVFPPDRGVRWTEWNGGWADVVSAVRCIDNSTAR